ncbi:transmembrane protein 180 [Lingula anatina]|uniref:Transmembrane protein 180 n=1 Tax=Lingula anatina TaxID=7574 RepID=A0A1S3HBV6_LINAN|nr:transmembrane protein 180 [Lingula anatina]|eukprot:XP_013383001.1 transmembrane protein 180 [Lingula anatina]
MPYSLQSSLLPLGLCYGSLALFTSILHNVFLLYHIETFVSIYKIDRTSFWIGETVFLIWNSFNDPLFGWISDRKYLSQKEGSHCPDIVLRRLQALTWNGPLFGLSFMVFWVSWHFPSLQFVICLCLYDGFLTMVDLHHSALLADLAISADTRTRLNSYCSVFSTLGSFSVFMSYMMWDKDTLTSFQLFCAALTVFSICGFLMSTRVMRKVYTKAAKQGVLETEKDSDEDEENAEWNQHTSTIKDYVTQLSKHRNFMWFSLMNLIQVFHCHFNSNFFPIFLENLLGDAISPPTASMLLGLSFVAPHINNLYFLSLCRKYGVYRVIQLLFAIKLGLSVVMLGLGRHHIWVLCAYIASNRIFTEGTCKLLNLVISDLVDEDFVLHNRNQAVSALMFGTAALVSKPGQTLAPLIGTWLLSVQTGHDIFQSGNEGGSIKLNMKTMPEHEKELQRQGCFTILVYIPIVCAILQLLAWSRFKLRGRRLRMIKSMRDGVETHKV